jgi:hypothetical protein
VEEWLIDVRRWLHKLKTRDARSSEERLRAGPNIDHLRVGALNDLVKNFNRDIGLGASRVLLKRPETEERAALLQSPQAPTRHAD